MTNTIYTIPDTDLDILKQHFTISDKWWDEARIIAQALIDLQKPKICIIKPWSTIATYMSLGNDINAKYCEYLSTEPLLLSMGISAALNVEMKKLLDIQAQPQQKGSRKRAPTDDELRDRWLKHQTLIAFGLGDWRKYENGIWQIIEEKGVKQQLQKIIEKAKREPVRPTSNRLFSVHEISKITCFIHAD